MKRNNFSLQLKKKISPAAYSWLLLALRQDTLVWDSLSKTTLADQALEKLSAKPEQWSPANLALLTKVAPAALERLAVDAAALPAVELNQQIAEARRAWQEKPHGILSLEQAGAIALSFRQEYLEKNSWASLVKLLHSSQQSSKSILACLLGLIPQPYALLVELFDPKDGERKLDLALHAWLCQPVSPDRQVDDLQKLLDNLPWGLGVELLDSLSHYRPWLAKKMAMWMVEAENNKTSGIFIDPLAGQFDQLAFSLQQVRLFKQAQQPAKATALLVEALKNARQLQGHISARLAQAVAQAKQIGEAEKQETDVEAWRQAVRLVPGDPVYATGLARALVAAGRLADAQLHLGSLQARDRNPAQAELLLVSCQAANGLGDKAAAARFARQALEQVENGSVLDAAGYKTLADFFTKTEQADLAARTLQAGGNAHPADAGLLEALARSYAASSRPSGAADYACAAAAVQIAYAENPQEYKLPLNMSLLLVESQEAMHAWQDAQKARIEMLSAVAKPRPEEYHAIARCALYAGNVDQSMAYSRRALEINAEDATALGWLGEAQTQGGEYISAIDNLRKAVRIAPNQANLWISLANACKHAGMEAQRLETLRSAVQALPDEAEIYLALGEVYLSRNAPSQALTYLRQAANLADNTNIALRLGQTLFQLGHQDEARLILADAYRNQQEAIQQGYELNGQEEHEIELAHAYARCLLSGNERAKAIELLERVVAAQPEQPAPHLDLSKALLKGQPSPEQARRAIALLQKAIQLISKAKLDSEKELLTVDLPVMEAEATGLLAEAYAASGEFKQSQDTYRKAMDSQALQKNGWRARLAMGFSRVALLLEQPETAVTVLKDAAQKDPQNTAIQRSLAEAYMANGLTQDAYDAASGVLAAQPMDLEALSWFVNIGDRLRRQPGALQTLVQLDMVRALQSAVHLAPERGDFLVQLGKLLLERGDRDTALETYRKLSALESDDRRVDAADLFQAAKTSREWGDAELSVALLQKAIEKEGATETKEKIQSGVPLVEMYRELSVSHQKAGSPDAALQAVDRAISIEPKQTRLHLQKADIYHAMRKPQAMLDSLKPALKLSPDGADVHHRVARALHISGDLPGALKHADQVLANKDTKKDARLDQATRFLAAEISYAMLKPRQALAYLPGELPVDGEMDEVLSQASLQAEIALDTGERNLAEKAIQVMRKLDAEDARSLAAQARMATLDGDAETSNRLLQAANHSLEKSYNKRPDRNQRGSADRERACCRGAAGCRKWKMAYHWSCRGAECAPNEPSSHLLKVEVIVARAEEQALCQSLQVTSHAPGAQALDDAARKEFEAALQEVERTVQAFSTAGGGETSQALNLWRARGKSVFTPIWENAASLEEAVGSFPPSANDVSAMIMAYRRNNQAAKAVKAAKSEFIATFGGKEVVEHPLVLAQLALAYARFDINQALECAAQAIQRTNPQKSDLGLNWPELPMLYYLQASLALQAGLFDTASQAIQKALSGWPEEARWHALAAQIYQGRDMQKGLPDLEKARTHLELATRLEPAYAGHFIALGKVYQDAGDLEKAARVLEHASQVAPKEANTWIALAQIQLTNGELELAAQSVERALEIAPDLAQALVLRGEIALQSKNPKGALSRAETVLQSQPDHVAALQLMAHSLEAMQRPHDALAVLERALSKVKDPLPMHMERLQLLRRSKGLEPSLVELQKLVDQNIRRPELLALLANWLVEVNKGEAAVQTARSAIQTDQGELTNEQKALLHHLIGQQMHKTGQLDQAIFAFSQAIQMEPSRLDFYLELAKTHQDRREYNQAIKVLEKAIEIAPDNYLPYYLAGTVYKDNKDYPAAEKMLRRAAKIAPRELSIHRMLGAVVALNLVHSR